jgi:hypothetical protein
MKYTYSDDEDSYLSDSAPRRSARTSNFLTEPTTTASGRQTRTRYGTLYGSGGESTAGTTPAYQGDDDEQRPAEARNGAYDSEGFDADSDGADEVSSGEEWAGEDGKPEEPEYGTDEEMDDVVSEEDDISPKSLVITLKYGKGTRQKLPERLNPTPSQSPSRIAPLKDINGTTKIEIDSLLTSNQPAHAIASKVQAPATPESEEKPKPLPSFANFLYKPTEESKPVTAKPAPTSSNAPTEAAASHFHAPSISVEALTGHPLAFSAPSS